MSERPRPLDERDLREHAAFLERLARRLVGDVHLAQDVVQEAYAAALTRRHEPRRSLRAWLAGVVRNRALMLRRGEARRRRREQVAEAARVVAGPAERAARLEAQELLVRAVRRLSQPYRDVIVLRFLEQREIADVAALTGVTESTVRTRVQRAIALLRERLDARHGGEGRAWRAALLGLPTRALEAPRPLALTASSALTPGVLSMLSKKSLVAIAFVLVLGLAAGSAVLLDPDGGASGDGPRAGSLPEQGAERSRRRADAGGDGIVLPAGSDGEDASHGSPDAGAEFAEVDRARDLFGVVRGRDGTPVVGARVSAHAQRYDRAVVLRRAAPTERVAGPSTLTAGRGRFVLRLAPGDEVDLDVRAEGFADFLLPGCPAGGRVDVTLSPAASLTVAVRLPGGRPAEGAMVRARRFAEGLAPVVRRRATAGADGLVRFGRLTPGDLYLEVEHPDFGAPRVPPFPIESGADHALELELSRGRTVSGRVVDAATGEGVGGATIGEGFLLARSVRATPDGSFVLRGFTGDLRRSLHCVAPGYARSQQVPPDEGEVILRLARGDAVVGRVLAPDGTPVADALVSAVGSHHTNAGQEIDSVSATTDAGGGFRLDGLRRDLPHTLVVQAPGHAKLLRDVLPRADGPGLISLGDLRLPAARTLAGVLLDADGKPLRGDVEITPRTPRPAGTYYGPAELRRTDDLGRFRFVGLAPDRYGIEAAVPGRPRLVTECEVPPDADVLDLRLELPEVRALSVEAVDHAGAPLAGVEIIVDSPDYVFETQTDAEGRAEIRAAHAAPWTVRLWPPRGGIGGRTFLSRVVDDVDPAAGPLRVVLVESASIRGRVTDASGEPLSRMVVRAERESEPGRAVATATSQGDGTFELAVPRGSDHRVVVDGERRSAASSVVYETLPVGAVAEGVSAPSSGLVLRAKPLPADRELVVRVVDPRGRPVEGARVLLAAAGGAPVPTPGVTPATTDAGGEARFAELTAQRVRVFVEHGDAPFGHADAVRPDWATVVPGDEPTEFAFREGVPLEGVVRTAAGDPAPGAVVRTSTMRGLLLSRSVTDSEGRFRTRGLAGRDHQFHVRYEREGAMTLERYVHGVRASTDVVLELE